MELNKERITYERIKANGFLVLKQYADNKIAMTQAVITINEPKQPFQSIIRTGISITIRPIITAETTIQVEMSVFPPLKSSIQ